MERKGLLVMLFTTLFACSGTSTSTPAPQGDSGVDGKTPIASNVDSKKICGFILSKDCPGAENTPSNLEKCVDAYDLGASRGCAAYIEKGWACLQAKSTSALTCAQNDVFVTDPACEEPGMVMAKCVTAVVDSACYGGSCKYSSDCPNGWSCNDVVGQCFQKSRACIGLPCKYSSDCSASAKCNDAIGVCVPL